MSTRPTPSVPPLNASRLQNAGSVLAFDFGEKRIGVAIGERTLGIAHPLTTIALSDNLRRFATIAALIKEWKPALLIVGLPAHMDGVEHELSKRCRRFANQLHGRFGLPVELIDERLTSAIADNMLREAGVSARKRKTLAATDQVAAQQILEAYFANALAMNKKNKE